MDAQRQITRLLHEEHLATISALNRLDALLADAGRGVPDPSEADVRRALNEIAAAIGGEVGPHFAFEEADLFPKLAEYGDSGMADLLVEEHRAILPLGEELSKLARTATETGRFEPESWTSFRELAVELYERMLSHIQKEEMGLIPVLDDILDEAEDADLVTAYLSAR